MKKLRTLTFTLFSVIIIYGVSFAQRESLFKNVIEQEVEVTALKLNLRTGPGLDYPVVGSVEKGQKLEVIGTLDKWYVVVLPDNSVGVISYQYVKVSKLGDKAYNVLNTQTNQGADDSSASENKDITDNTSTEVIYESNAEKLFDLMNKARVENKLPPFTWDETLNRIAEIKAKDMADNDYFEHNSPVYGTPFAMLKQMDVFYLSASENIARNNSVENAHLELMSSVHHRVNVLNSRFNKAGIGICDSKEWGKIIVQIFIED